MQIGPKIMALRKRYGLTQEELADRAELSKGFISQLERDLTSPSIATLTDILQCLGTTLPEFFSDQRDETIVFGPQDVFEKTDEQSGVSITWLIPHAQRNSMEPILYTLDPGCEGEMDDPHEGEEFGHVLAGRPTLVLDGQPHKLKKGDSFCFKTTMPHGMVNYGKTQARVLWISTPPSF